MAKTKIQVGDKVVFNGYSEGTPEDDQVLETGQEYEVKELGEEGSLVLEALNPDFDSKKRESKANPKTVLADVFDDEVTLVEAEEAPAPRKTTTKKAPVRKAAEKVVDEEDEEEDEEEAPVAKTTAAKTTAARSTAAKTTAARSTAAKTTAAKTTATKAASAKTTAAKTTATKAASTKTATKTATKAVAKKAAAKPVAEDVDEDELPDLENEDEDVLALVMGAEDVLELAEELVEEGAHIDYKLGGVLYHVRKEKAHRQLDERYTEKGGFGLYVKEKLNIEYRKAMYLIDIYVKFNQNGISGEKVAEIGWTKASKIAAVMNQDNAEELIELAETNSVADLSDTIKESYVKVSDGTPTEKIKRITFRFRLVEDSADFVQKIIEDCAATLGTKNLNTTFEHIVGEWAAEHANVRKTTRATKTTKTTTKTTARRGKAVEEEGEE